MTKPPREIADELVKKIDKSWDSPYFIQNSTEWIEQALISQRQEGFGEGVRKAADRVDKLDSAWRNGDTTQFVPNFKQTVLDLLPKREG